MNNNTPNEPLTNIHVKLPKNETTTTIIPNSKSATKKNRVTKKTLNNKIHYHS